MYICAEKYFKLTQKEYLKIKQFMNNNIYTVEAILPPMHEFFDLFVHVIVIVSKIIENVYVLLINILNFVKKIVLFLKKL